MARGLGTGLVQGAVIGALALAGLSLWAPMPRSGTAPLAVDLPVGSEFGRGDDRAPLRPAPNAASPRDMSDPAPVPAPVPEAAPVTAATDTARPATLAADVPALRAPADAAPAPTLPARAQPSTLPAPVVAPDPGAGQDAPPRIAPEQAVPGIAVPALPSPGLDLSLPPDLSDLQTPEGD